MEPDYSSQPNPADHIQDSPETGIESKEPDTILPASLKDVDAIREIMQDASEFKLRQGDDAWGPAPFTNEEVIQMVESGNLFVYKNHEKIAAVVLLPESDVRIWGETQGQDGSSIYIHRFCVGSEFRGKSVGEKVMTLVEDYARSKGKVKLRLDCPYDNRPLCEYYERLGFREVKRFDQILSPGRRNPEKEVYRAALYEKIITD